MANIYKNSKKFEESIKYYSKVLKKINKNSAAYADVLYKRGSSYERLGDNESSDKDLLKSLSIKPNDPYVLNYLGYSYLDKDLDLKLAKELIEKAMSLKPNDPYIIDSMAWYYFKVGRFEEALSLLDYAIDMMPYDPTINDHYADALWKIGHKLQARYHWERAIELDTEGELKDQIKEKLLIGI